MICPLDIVFGQRLATSRAATANLAWDAPLPANLAALEPSALLQPETVATARGVNEAPPSFPSAVGSDKHGSGRGNGAAATAAAKRLAAPGDDPGAGAAADSGGGADADGGKPKGPKWLKM